MSNCFYLKRQLIKTYKSKLYKKFVPCDFPNAPSSALIQTNSLCTFYLTLNWAIKPIAPSYKSEFSVLVKRKNNFYVSIFFTF